MIRDNMKFLTNKSLVVFDVDDTLIRMYGDSPYFLSIKDTVLIDETTPSLINELKINDVKVFALTLCSSHYLVKTGAASRTYRFYDFRYQQLSQKKIGIDFSLPISKTLGKHFRVPTERIHGKDYAYPFIYKRIIFTNSETNKGVVLTSFLKRFKLKPDFIIFVDNDFTHNMEVAMNLEPLKRNKDNPLRDYLCLHYTGAQYLPRC